MTGGERSSGQGDVVGELSTHSSLRRVQRCQDATLGNINTVDFLQMRSLVAQVVLRICPKEPPNTDSGWERSCRFPVPFKTRGVLNFM